MSMRPLSRIIASRPVARNALAARAALVLLALSIAAVAASAEPRAATAPAELAGLRAQARGVLEKHCGTCHISYLPSRLPFALRVYDLADDEWYLRLDRPKLESALLRLQSNGETPPAEIRVFARFVDAELAARPDSWIAAKPAAKINSKINSKLRK